MLAIKTSPTKSESSSTSKADDTSSSAYPVSWLYSNPVVDLQSPKRSSADLIRDQKEEESPPSLADESFEEEYSGPYPKPKPGYTCRLIPIIRVPADEIDENFDEDAWNKKVFGADVIVVDMSSVPEGWVLVDGNPRRFEYLLIVDPSPPPKKKKKRWNRFDRDDPNMEGNLDRARFGMPPVDEWNIGIEYIYRSNAQLFCFC